jgi:hypothetical protein
MTPNFSTAACTDLFVCKSLFAIVVSALYGPRLGRLRESVGYCRCSCKTADFIAKALKSKD